MAQEHRGSQRQRILKPAKITFGGGAIDCVVRNISETGAALVVESPVGIPEKFNLVTGAASMARRCRVIWRREKLIGIRFEI